MAFPADLSLYVHIPFCRLKCRYCDFFSLSGADNLLMDRVVETLLAEAESELTRLKPQSIPTLFIGGGTPSLLGAVRLDYLLKQLGRLFPGGMENGPEEISIEVNPESLNAEILEVLKNRGVNRISMGVQSYSEEALGWLGRPAGRGALLKAERLLAEHWSGRLSRDLLAGLPPQLNRSLQEDVDMALKGRPGHLSVYSLTVEEGTPLSNDRTRLAALPKESAAAEEWKRLCRYLETQGYERYEVSNFALPGQQCRHNLRYWRMQFSLGIGPGAASTIPAENGTVIRRENPRDISQWQKIVEHEASKVREGREGRAKLPGNCTAQASRAASTAPNTVSGQLSPFSPAAAGAPGAPGAANFGRDTLISPYSLALEYYMMGLRLKEGLDRPRFQTVFGRDPTELIPRTAQRWSGRGLLSVSDRSMALSSEGLDWLDALLRDIAAELDESFGN